jgi:hypothetical protein
VQKGNQFIRGCCNAGVGQHNTLAKHGNLPAGFMHVYANVKNPVAKVNNFHTFTLRCGLAGRWFHILFFLMKKQDTSFCSKLLKRDCWPPRLFLHIDLAKVAVQCSADTFVVNQSLVLRINICGENRHLRQARNR